MSKAVFLDRDGTLMVDHGYVGDPYQVELLPGVVPALLALQGAGYSLIVVSNQSGIGRGLLTEADVDAVNQRLRAILGNHGVRLSGIYYCPHSPEYGCDCRKPKPGLLLAALYGHHLNPAECYMLGDKWSDVEAGAAAGVTPVYVGTRIEEPPGRVNAMQTANSVLDWTMRMQREGLL
ncbi:MAG: HAD family hydrolase [Cohnella sp.]|nr:HAD family hydrolase [Cohnella sp.]